MTSSRTTGDMPRVDGDSNRAEGVEGFISTKCDSETTAKKYDEWAARYDEDVQSRTYGGPRKLAEIFEKLDQAKDAAIIDWGAGTGLVGEELHSRGFTSVTGLDISQKSLDVAKQKGVYSKLVYVEPGSQGHCKILEDDEFDAIVSCGVIMPNGLPPEAFHDWVRIVRPGGLILVLARLAYLERTEQHPNYFNEDLAVEFGNVVGDLEKSNRWETISRAVFSGFIEDFDGVAYLFRVI